MAPIVFDGLQVSPYEEASNNVNKDKIVSSYTWVDDDINVYFLAAPTQDQSTITSSGYTIYFPNVRLLSSNFFYNAQEKKFEYYENLVIDPSTGEPTDESKVVARFAATLYNNGDYAQAYFWSYNTGKAYRLWCNVYNPSCCEWDAEESYDGKAFAVYYEE